VGKDREQREVPHVLNDVTRIVRSASAAGPEPTERRRQTETQDG